VGKLKSLRSLSRRILNLFACNYVWSCNEDGCMLQSHEPSTLHAVFGSRITGGCKTMTSRCSRGSDTVARKRETGASERSKRGDAQAVRTQEKRRACKPTRRCALLCPNELLFSARIIVLNGMKTRTGRTSENMVLTSPTQKKCLTAFFSSCQMFREDYGGNRWVGIGTIRGRTTVAVFTERGPETIRIISLR
jgi:hypothetical protein